MKKHYLHVSFMKTINGSIDYTSHALVQMTSDKDFAWLKEELRKITSKDVGVEVSEPPIIISMTELSESLYKCLQGL